jgi:Tol biopolymer transport system component
MKTMALAAAVLLLGMSPHDQAPAPAAAAELANVLPPDAKAEQVVLTSDEKRTYYTTTAGDIWFYDRGTSRSARVFTGVVWDLAVSPSLDALVFTMGGETRVEQHVWLLPLDPKTGLASGSTRRLSTQSADGPSPSPDGRSIAFARDDATGVGQSLVVVPASGGAGRVVAAGLPSGISSIRWTPDGATLYFGVNPPVPFTCAESCLSLPGGSAVSSGTIRRVAASGGAVQIVATTGNPSPGLSPDGAKLAFTDVSGNRQIVVADATGRRLNAVTVPPGQVLLGWAGASKLLTMATGTLRRLRAVSLPDGASRTLFESTAFAAAPIWSRDGNTVSIIHGTGTCEFRMMKRDGTLVRTIPLPRGCGDSPAWTGDERAIVFAGSPPDGPRMITAIDVATNQTKALRERPAADMGWTLDAQVVVSAVTDGSGPQRRVSFWQTDLGGTSTVLRDLPFEQPSWSVAAPVDRSTALLMRTTPPELRLVSLDGSAGDRTITPGRRGYVLPRPALSADRQWVALRINPSGNDATRMSVVEVIRTDGGARQSIDLPFFAQDQDTLRILPGGKELVVVERPAGATEPGVYLVGVAAGSVKKLLTYIPRGRGPELAVSPDGRTLLTLTTDTAKPSISAMDLSQIK